MSRVKNSDYHQLNPKFSIPLKELEERILHIFPRQFEEYKTVRSVKDIAFIHDISLMQESELQALLRSIPLQSDHSIFPYHAANISFPSVSPHFLALGQTYVQKDKLLHFISKTSTLFGKYVTPGISSLPPMMIYGESYDAKNVLAFYLPPLVEKHDGLPVLIDGLHRSVVAHAAGTTISSLHLDRIEAPLHFIPSVAWDSLQYVDVKPPLEERFQGLKMEYFRDFSYVGIDG
ncbi:MAG: hypothetical protein Q8R37_01575 [Nanoarchaeota archaeon]|nr:hypothetical protein [Nanoarchaeota archaeon]